MSVPNKTGLFITVPSDYQYNRKDDSEEEAFIKQKLAMIPLEPLPTPIPELPKEEREDSNQKIYAKYSKTRGNWNNGITNTFRNIGR